MELPVIPAHLAMALESDVVGLVASRAVVKNKRRETTLPPLPPVPLQIVHQTMQEVTFTEI